MHLYSTWTLAHSLVFFWCVCLALISGDDTSLIKWVCNVLYSSHFWNVLFSSHVPVKLSFCLESFFFFKFWNQYTYLFLVCSDFLFLHELALAAHVFSMNLSISFILSNLSTCNCSHHALLLLLLFISVKLVVSSPFSFLILVTWDFSLFSWSSSLKFCQCCWSQRRNFCLWFSLLFFYTLFPFIWPPNYYFLPSASFGYSSPFFY